MMKPCLMEAVRKWRSGEIVSTIELGGISPGYEQSIQILLFEICARWEGPQLTWEEQTKIYPANYTAHVDAVVKLLDPKLGFSGAQVGAAKATAFQFLCFGFDHMMAQVPSDRRIQTQRHFPSWEA